MRYNGSIYDEISQDIRINKDFQSSFETLLQDSILNSLGLKTGSDLSIQSINKLIEASAIFSLSNDYYKEFGLRILNNIIICGIENPQILSTIKLLLIRLGNFPTVNMLEGIDIISKSILEIDLGFRSEVLGKYYTNKLDENTFLTDFQADLFYSLVDNNSLSFSAPTSAGKSFAIIKYILKVLQENEKITVCLVVPTKALISQFYMDFNEEFNKSDLNDISITTTTTNITFNDTLPKQLLLLTQERLQYCIFNKLDRDLVIDLLVIDEAQKIGDSSRGVILESVVTETLRRNPHAQVVFSAPLADNPEVLNKIFLTKKSMNSRSLISEFSPVPQNIFQVSLFNNHLHLNLVYEGRSIKLDTNISLERDVVGVYNRIAAIAASLGGLNNQLNIVFCNGPKAAEKISESLCKITSQSNDEIINDFISFLEDEIHPLFNLIDSLKFNIGFHYSDLPTAVRNKVEELYKSGKLRFLCCTSTLLEGVNLPAKNIFIYRPQEGLGNTMSDQTFWNLAGRAGRLTKELAGNVFCIDTNQWKSHPFLSEKKYEIKAATEKVLEDEPDDFINYLNDYKKWHHNNTLYEQTASFFINRRITNNNDTIEQFSSDRVLQLADLSKVKLMDEIIQNISIRITIPLEILKRNSSIDPQKQQRLYDFMKKNLQRINNFIPYHPKSKHAYDRLLFIFRVVDVLLANKTGRSYKYFAQLAISWMREKNLREIVVKQINYEANKNNDHMISNNKHFVNDVIRNVSANINNNLSFHYARLTQCYVDILNLVLDGEIPENGDLSLPFYLENGVSRPSSIYSISIGASRSLAVRLSRIFNQKAVARMENFDTWVSNNQKIILPLLPNTMKEEFKNIFG